MTWLITAIAITRETRRRAGKSWTAVYETLSTDPLVAEERYERDYNIDHPRETCKVIDVRPLPKEREGNCICGRPVWAHFDQRNEKIPCATVAFISERSR